MSSSRADAFRKLHAAGTFVMPNPFDVGSTRLLSSLGFQALATTSAGFAATLGRLDMSVSLDDLLGHVAALTAATELPLNVDSERCFAEDLAGIGATIAALADAGAAGCSIEDWNPVTGKVDGLEDATKRVAAAAAAARKAGIVLTARCENHIRGVTDFEDTMRRLIAYVQAGAEVAYAPGLVDLAQLRRVVEEVGAPINALLIPKGPSVSQLADVGVRRISVGSGLSTIAYGAMIGAAKELLASGTIAAAANFDRKLVADAFKPQPLPQGGQGIIALSSAKSSR